MGDWQIIFCKTCQQIQTLEIYELPDYIQEHEEHKLVLLPSDWPDDTDELVGGLYRVLGWKPEA